MVVLFHLNLESIIFWLSLSINDTISPNWQELALGSLEPLEIKGFCGWIQRNLWNVNEKMVKRVKKEIE
jgi:hypothetical protein